MAVEKFGVELLISLGIEDETFEVWKGRLLRDGDSEEIKVRRLLHDHSEEEGSKLRSDIAASPSFGVNSKYICKIYGTTVLEGRTSVLMSYYKETLRTRVQSVGMMSLREIQRCGEQICLAFATLHERDRYVGALDLRKFVFDESDNCILADFGASWFYNANFEAGDITTSQNAYITPEAIDPEQWGAMSVRTDSWNLAFALLEMLCGRRPWDDFSRSEQINKLMNGEVPLIPTLPPLLHQLLTRCLSIDPLDRPKISGLVSVFRSDWNQNPLATSSSSVGKIISLIHPPPAHCPSPSLSFDNNGTKVGRADSANILLQTDLGQSMANDGTQSAKSSSFQKQSQHKGPDTETVPVLMASEDSTNKGNQPHGPLINTAVAKEAKERSLEDSILLSQQELRELSTLQDNWASLRHNFSEQLQRLTQEKDTAKLEKTAIEKKLKLLVQESSTQNDLLQRALNQTVETMEVDCKIISELTKVAFAILSNKEQLESKAGTAIEEINILRRANEGLKEACVQTELRSTRLQDEYKLREIQHAQKLASLEERSLQLQLQIDHLEAASGKDHEAIKAANANTEKLLQNIASLQAENRKIQNQYFSEQKMWAASTSQTEQLLQRIVAIERENHDLDEKVRAREEENSKITGLLAMHKKIWETEKEVLESQSKISQISKFRQQVVPDDPVLELAFARFASLCGVCLTFLKSANGYLDGEHKSEEISQDIMAGHRLHTSAGEQIVSAMRTLHPSTTTHTLADEMTQFSALASAARVSTRPHQAEALYRLAVLTFRVQQMPYSSTSEEVENLPVGSEKVYGLASISGSLDRAMNEKTLPRFERAMNHNTVSDYKNEKTSIEPIRMQQTGESTRVSPPLLPQAYRSGISHSSVQRPIPRNENTIMESKGESIGLDQRLVLGLVLEGRLISKILAGSPSYLAGLKVGDEVVVINGFAVSSNDAIRILREAMDRASQYRALSPDGDIEMRISVLRSNAIIERQVIFQGSKQGEASAEYHQAVPPLSPRRVQAWSPWVRPAREVNNAAPSDDRGINHLAAEQQNNNAVNRGQQIAEPRHALYRNHDSPTPSIYQSPTSSPPEISGPQGAPSKDVAAAAKFSAQAATVSPSVFVSNHASGAHLIF